MLPQPQTCITDSYYLHGVEPKSEGGHVELAASRDGDSLILEVSDDGPGFPEEVIALTGAPLASDASSSERRGIGLANGRARIEMLYGAEGGLELSNRPDGGARVRVRIPWRT